MSVTFRLLRREDRDRLLDWRNSPEVSAFMYTDRRITPAEHAAWFDAIPGDKRRAYWMIKIDGHRAGLLNLYDIVPEQGRASWAYYLAEPSARGRGVGAYVEYRLLRHVFEAMRLHKLWCEVLSSNPAVIKLHKRFGFTAEAVLREQVMKGGQWVDVVGLGLLAHEWPAARAAAEPLLSAAGYDLSKEPSLDQP